VKATNLSTILDIEFNAKNNHTPVMIWGAPGIGKSAIVRSIADKYGVKMIDIRLSQMEPSDLRGIPFQNKDLVEWSVPAMLPNAKRHGEYGILFLDEITSAPPTVSAAAYQLILDRKLGEYELPEGWVIFAAGNRAGDRGVNFVMPAPLANRFSHYELDVNLDDWVLWAYKNNIDERIIAFLRYRPEHLFSFDTEKNPISFASPRTWEFASKALHKFENKQGVILPALSGCVSEGIAIELMSFIKNLEDMPSLDDIINGKEVMIPESVDLQYAICTALVGRAIAATTNKGQILGNILNFATGFKQQELGVMLVSDMARVIGDEIFALPAFDLWATKVSDVIFD
jgi:hypothetical protein